MNDGIIRKRSEPIEALRVSADVKLTEQEQEGLNLSLAELSPHQYKAACLEASGTSDRGMIAQQIGVSVAAVSSWRAMENYQRAITLNIIIIDRMSRETRIKYDSLILTPAYAELIKRINDPHEMENLGIKDIVEVITKINKEMRLDTIIATDGADDTDLADLQRRRKLIQAKQGMAMEQIKNNNNIIQFPNQQKQAV